MTKAEKRSFLLNNFRLDELKWREFYHGKRLIASKTFHFHINQLKFYFFVFFLRKRQGKLGCKKKSKHFILHDILPFACYNPVCRLIIHLSLHIFEKSEKICSRIIKKNFSLTPLTCFLEVLKAFSESFQ
jgi:hypothetical protein